MSSKWSWVFTGLFLLILFPSTFTAVINVSQRSTLAHRSRLLLGRDENQTSGRTESYAVPAGSNPVRIGALVGLVLALICVGICVIILMLNRRKKAAQKRKRQKWLSGFDPVFAHGDKGLSKAEKATDSPLPMRTDDPKLFRSHQTPLMTIKEVPVTPSSAGSAKLMMPEPMSNSPPTYHESLGRQPFGAALPQAPFEVRSPPRAQIPPRARSFKRQSDSQPTRAYRTPSRSTSPPISGSRKQRRKRSHSGSGSSTASSAHGRYSPSAISRDGTKALLRTPSGRFELKTRSQILHMGHNRQGSTSSCSSCASCHCKSGSISRPRGRSPPRFNSHFRNGSQTSGLTGSSGRTLVSGQSSQQGDSLHAYIGRQSPPAHVRSDSENSSNSGYGAGSSGDESDATSGSSLPAFPMPTTLERNNSDASTGSDLSYATTSDGESHYSDGEPPINPAMAAYMMGYAEQDLAALPIPEMSEEPPRSPLRPVEKGQSFLIPRKAPSPPESSSSEDSRGGTPGTLTEMDEREIATRKYTESQMFSLDSQFWRDPETGLPPMVVVGEDYSAETADEPLASTESSIHDPHSGMRSPRHEGRPAIIHSDSEESIPGVSPGVPF